MSRIIYSAYIADGFADDCEELILRCSRTQVLSYTTFCEIYKDMRFCGAYRGRMSAYEIVELTEEFLHIAKHYMITDTSNFDECIAGLFLVYTILNHQPFPLFAPLRLIPEDLPGLHRIKTVARREKRLDVLYILAHVLIVGPVQCHVDNRTRGMEIGLRKHFEAAGIMELSGLNAKGVFKRQDIALDSFRELAYMDRLYRSSKLRVEQVYYKGQADRNLSYFAKDHISNLDSSLRWVISGISDNGSEPLHCDRMQALKSRAMEIPVGSMGHLTGVNERSKKSRKRKSVSSEDFDFVEPKSPVKRSRIHTISVAQSSVSELPLTSKSPLSPKKTSDWTLKTRRIAVEKSHIMRRLKDVSDDDVEVEVIESTNNNEVDINSGNKDMMILDDFDDNTDQKNKGNDMALKEIKQAKTLVCAVNTKNGTKVSRKRKLSPKKRSAGSSKRSARGSKFRRQRQSSSSGSDSESDIELPSDSDDDDLYSVTDDLENLTETIDEDIRRLQTYEQLKKTDTIQQTNNKSPMKERNETYIASNTENQAKLDNKHVDEVLTKYIETGVPVVLQTENPNEFIHIEVVDNFGGANKQNVDTADNSVAANKKEEETADTLRSLRTRRVTATNSSENEVKSPDNEVKSSETEVKSPKKKLKSLTKVGTPGNEKTPVKKEDVITKQNTGNNKMNAPKKTKAKDVQPKPIEKKDKSPKKTSNIDLKSLKTPKRNKNTPKSPKTAKDTDTTKRSTRSKVSDSAIETSLPNDETITKNNKRSVKTNSPRRSPRRTDSMAQLTLVESPIAKKRKVRERRDMKKTKIKNRFRHMGILPVANFNEEVKVDKVKGFRGFKSP